MEPVAGAAPPLISRLRVRLGAVALVAFAFVQAPGRVVGDTKADLVIDPAHFLARALQTWNGVQGFGQLGNQTYGYLFPMGPFFLVGHEVGLPGWWTQRLWWVLLLLVGYYGTHRLATALGVGTPGARLAGALAYALAPRVLTVLGGISVEAWPGALVPWALLPLVLAEQGRLTPRRAAALSGAAALAMGAVNAAATVAALAVPACYLLAGVGRPFGRRLFGWWLLSTALASAWWLGPLLILNRYGFPFLDYIENAHITTSTTGVFDTLRGAEHWGGYLLSGGYPRWPAGFALSYELLAILCTCLLAGAGLAGLCGRDLPGAARWRTCAVAGLVVVCAGHAGSLGGAAAAGVDTLLDGPLAALRNVHKFDPLLRLPLALGLAALLGRLLAADRTPLRVDRPWGWRRLRVRRLPAPAGVAAAVVLFALAGTLLPGVQQGEAPPGASRGVPGYWPRVADWLDGHAVSGSALLVPSSNFAVYRWGSPQDEPLQALARSAWAVRDAVPLGAPGSYRILDGIDPVLAEGRPSPLIAPALARMGVGYLVLRNDLDPVAAGAEQPRVVRAALAGSPGLRRAAVFGRHRAVEVFAVPGATPPLTTRPAASALALSGGPEGTVGAAGALGDRAALLLGDVGSRPVAGVVVGDTGRRRSLGFGYAAAVPRVGADGEPLDAADDLARYSPTLPLSADPKGDRPAAQFGPELPADRQTVSSLEGVRAVTASSSAADPFGRFYRGVADRPESALDGDRATRWISAGDDAVGQWLAVDLASTIDERAVTVRFVDDRDVGPQVTQVAVRTDAGTAHDSVRRGTAEQRLALPPGRTRSLRITVTKVHGRSAGGQVGIADLLMPGLFPQAVLTTATSFPASVTGKPTAVRLDRTAGDRSACVLASPSAVCSPTLAHQGEEVMPYARVVRTPGPVGASGQATLRAVAGGSELARLAARAVATRASASSVAVRALAGSALAAVDGDRATAWTPRAQDRIPRLRLTFPSDPAGRPVTIRGTFPKGTRVDVATESGHVSRTARHGRIAPVLLAGRDWIVTVHRAHRHDTVAVSDVRVTGLPAAPRTVTVPCGLGPSVTVDGTGTGLSVSATVRQLMGGAQLAARPCTPFTGFAAGRHRIRFVDTGAFVVTGLGLGFGQLPTAPGRRARLTQQGESRYRATVAPGPPAYAQLDTSADAGWRATLDGRPLAGVRLDGWRQGFLLPAATSAGRLVVTFGPATTEAATLGAGVGAILLLVLLGVLPARDVRRRMAAPRGTWRPGVAAVWLGRFAALVLGLLVAGPAGALLAVAATALPPRWRPGAAAGAMLLAGVCAVLAPGLWLATLCAAAAAGVLLGATLDLATRGP